MIIKVRCLIIIAKAGQSVCGVFFWLELESIVFDELG